MKSYLIHLLRNMPCEGNLEGRYIGRTESPLPMESVVRLAELKRTCDYPTAERFYAAPSTRCVDTLKVLYPEADPEVVLELAECDFGDWEGKTAEELKNEPGFLAWMGDSGQSAPPNGESGPVFVRRVCSGFEMLVQNLVAEGTTSAALVVTSGVLTTLLSGYGLPRAGAYDWMCPPGHGYTVRITPGLWMRSHVMEVVKTIPDVPGERLPEADADQRLVIDLAREAADRAYGRGPGEDQ